MFRQFSDFLDDKTCRVILSPFDVRLFADPDLPDEETDTGTHNTVVEPDIIVICDRRKLNEKNAHGAPDIAIEILSPSDPAHDTKVKYNLYLKAGVREYWIVDPETEIVTVYILKDGLYNAAQYAPRAKIPSSVLNGFQADMEKVFKEVEKMLPASA
jgi:Uma2 family endonuclease